MHDLIITGGTIVDGTGAPRYTADIAIEGGRIAAIGHDLGEARETVDATGSMVTPGFVDIHTHYDGQATWDDLLEPSSGHGVTTVVAGNCGVGFAPVHPGKEEWLVQLMEGVEDIPGTALHEGISWGWESSPSTSTCWTRDATRSTSPPTSGTARCAPTSWATVVRATNPPRPRTSPG